VLQLSDPWLGKKYVRVGEREAGKEVLAGLAMRDQERSFKGTVVYSATVASSCISKSNYSEYLVQSCAM